MRTIFFSTEWSSLRKITMHFNMMSMSWMPGVPVNYCGSTLTMQGHVLLQKSKKTIPCQFLLNRSPIETVDRFGVNIACDLSWTKHIQLIVSKARRVVGPLYQQFYYSAYTITLESNRYLSSDLTWRLPAQCTQMSIEKNPIALA